MKSFEDRYCSMVVPAKARRLGAVSLLVASLGAASACAGSRPCEAEIPLSNSSEMTTTTIHLPGSDAVYASAFRVDERGVKLVVTKTPVGGRLMSEIMTEGTETERLQYQLGEKNNLNFQLTDSAVTSYCTSAKA